MSYSYDPKLDDIVVGSNIRFKSVNAHDNVLWNGTVNAICNYRAAKAFSDIDAYYTDIKKYDNLLPAKEELQYLVLEVVENGNMTSTRVFAKEWIDTSTLEFVDADSDKYRDIRIYQISSEGLRQIMNLIYDNGYSCCEIS